MCYDPLIRNKTEELLFNKKAFTLDRLLALKKLKVDMYKDLHNIKVSESKSNINIYKNYRKSIGINIFLNVI